MLVIVKKDYFDLQADKALRKKGQLLEYKNEKRANELLAKGFVRQVEIQEVEDPEEVDDPEGAKKAEEVENPEKVEETEEVKTTEEAEEVKEEAKKRPTKK